MTTLREAIRRIFPPHQSVAPGTYQYQSPADVQPPYRLHLRVEPDGTGILIINASTILHLNQTATEFAYFMVKSTPEGEVIQSVAARYKVDRQQAAQDYRDLTDRIQTLIATPDLDPVTYLDFERNAPYSQELSAPYRLDCALTYRIDSHAQIFAPHERVRREMTTDEWKQVVSKAWDVGIPQTIFTGGEPTLRDDLVELISYSQEKGQVTGLLTDGLRFTDPKYLQNVLQAGLDHLMLVFNPQEEQSWEALRDLLAADLFVTVHLTVTEENVQDAPDLLVKLSRLGVKALSLSGASPQVYDDLGELREQAARMQIELIWDIPVPYSSAHPVALELEGEERVPDGAGRAWLYVEPDGDVLPSQGVNIVLGNLLADPWEKIWTAARDFRS